jgi:hypothetical protein
MHAILALAVIGAAVLAARRCTRPGRDAVALPNDLADEADANASSRGHSLAWSRLGRRMTGRCPCDAQTRLRIRRDRRIDTDTDPSMSRSCALAREESWL